MSRAPWVVMKPDRPYARTDQTLVSTTLGWRLVNPKMPGEWTVSLGEGAEILADEYEVSREAQDKFALKSHQRAAAAWDGGAYAEETVGVPDVELERDEPIRADSSLEKLAKLKPAFREDGSVTAGNASPLNDGAAALLLANEAGVEAIGREPMARIASRGVHAVDPPLYGIAPVEASNKALERAGIGWGDVEAVELNEAFAAQALACLSQWPELAADRLNVNGGAVALGHPIGCSGARVLTTLVHELRRRGGGYGLATLCIGVGQGISMVVEAA
jgi:acetyl-CoA acetyltransferase family protein